MITVLIVIGLIILALGTGWLTHYRRRERSQQNYMVQKEKRVAFGDLLSGLVHELNNPLTFVYSNLEPMRDSILYLKGIISNPDEKTIKVFHHLEKTIGHMEDGMMRAQKLIEQFRSIPSGVRPTKEEIDLNALLNKCIDLLAHKWKDKIQIERSFDETQKLLGVPGELEQAFTNILVNAMDATPDGGLIQVSSHEISDGVKILIRDNGKGIPREIISRIFDPFFTTKGQGEGQGLGLAMTQQIIKQHRGSIEVKSEVGKGTDFLVLLPY